MLTLALQCGGPDPLAAFESALGLLQKVQLVHPNGVNEQHLTVVLSLCQQAAAVSAHPSDVVRRGMALYEGHPDSQRGNVVLDNAALFLYTGLPSEVMRRDGSLFEEALALFEVSRTAGEQRTPS